MVHWCHNLLLLLRFARFRRSSAQQNQRPFPIPHPAAHSPVAHYPDIRKRRRCLCTHPPVADIRQTRYGRHFSLYTSHASHFCGMGLCWKFYVER